MESESSLSTSHDLAQDLSFSMVVDEEFTGNRDKFQQSDRGPHVFSNIQKRTIHSWISDDSVTECYRCKKEFGWTSRKHHCRACGRIFCYYCCSNWVKLPSSKEHLPQAPPGSMFQSVVNMVVGDKTERVCDICSTKLRELEQLEVIISIFERWLDLQDLGKVLTVSKVWYKASLYCLSKLREIQYRLPFKQLTKREISMLNLNRTYFTGHNKWMVQLIRMANLTKENEVKEIIDMLRDTKRRNCWGLMCSRSCQPHLSGIDVVQLISINPLPLNISTILVKSLDTLSDQLVSMCLPLFRKQVLYELQCDEYVFVDWLFTYGMKKPDMMMAWLVDINHQRWDQRYDGLFWHLMNRIRKENQTRFAKLDSIFNTLSILKAEDASTPLIKSLYNTWWSMEKIDLPLGEFSGIDISNVKEMPSKMRPIKVPLILKEGSDERKNILIKRDDVRQDYLIQRIISLMTYLIKSEMKIDPQVITYGIIPISPELGIIEMVEDAVTLSEILTDGFTIQNYIIEHNQSKVVAELRERFIRSTAAYCVITYLLGVGDRHLDNIMIHQRGSLFHIDYGWIMGCDPKLTETIVRISPEMLDAMGGRESDNYRHFRELCTQVYNTVRVHVGLISSYLMLLNEINPKVYTHKKIMKEVLKRFEPGVNQPDAKCHLFNLMDRSYSNHWKYNLIDFFHSGSLSSFWKS